MVDNNIFPSAPNFVNRFYYKNIQFNHSRENLNL